MSIWIGGASRYPNQDSPPATLLSDTRLTRTLDVQPTGLAAGHARPVTLHWVKRVRREPVVGAGVPGGLLNSLSPISVFIWIKGRLGTATRFHPLPR